MGRYTGPRCRLCRTESKRLFLKGDKCKSDKCPINRKRPLPGRDPKVRAKKQTDYAVQLREKQKLKKSYGMQEKQFRLTFEKAARMPGKTGETLLTLLERRLDNVAYRLRFASSRAQARQVVLHGHVQVNGKRVNIPSYILKAGDVVSIHPAYRTNKVLLGALGEYEKSGVMPWLSLDVGKCEGKLNIIPQRQDITDMADIREQLVVELYSK
ncbi:MAG: 30S ribosomal protein S4 [Spirochaetes bacterium GWD1_61_31]|nr:MAG: 30S ribosomal protein S4 [Spirochaetes bacterium GWB1_60_80]OHD29909.1 MAG: 30S ribosomal protein S4 [Spirochaetes bacterium GWC1_61_12]OHD43766.1 MAG: 30S ribosomal protein S4 [Spirochaetes bacterium GWD1_61_31]OHD46008.1 MAG: 30S ribosomal protein S4 [Spirochaetes bacterium GWE1_60_18]OHD60580.1 MAG: 30S ribosomal protein S4 [Spirochaetes bacterium GWF1_60_12]HAP43416.1 30S ribosomal protein S4 [Spirochaetaceae bacterium]